MTLRSIPPKTSTGSGRRLVRQPAIRTAYSAKIEHLQKEIKKTAAYKPVRPVVQRKPREWRYVTKPFFSKIKEPLVDVFKEAQEIQIIIDMGGFTRGEFSFGLKEGKYTVYGKHEQQEFEEVIDLPEGADLDNIVESFKNNILTLVIPKETESSVNKKKKEIKLDKKGKSKRKKR